MVLEEQGNVGNSRAVFTGQENVSAVHPGPERNVYIKVQSSFPFHPTTPPGGRGKIHPFTSDGLSFNSPGLSLSTTTFRL